MSQQRALPHKIVAQAPRSTARTRTAPAARIPHALGGALLVASLVGLTPASADPETLPSGSAPAVPAPVAQAPFVPVIPSPGAAAPITMPVGSPIAAAPAPVQAVPQSFGSMPVDPQLITSATSYIPALIGAVSEPGVRETDQTQRLLQQLQNVVSQANLPPEYRNSIYQAASLLRNQQGGEPLEMPAPPAAGQDAAPGSPALPPGDEFAPKIQEFMLPTIGMNCIEGADGDGNAIGKALVTAGPQEAPAPGPKEGEAGYVFTALGTGAAITDEEHPLAVNWFNLDTGTKGQAKLLPNPAINATTGPATFTAIIPTGKGRVLSTVFGTVTAKTTEGEQRSCSITPTVGLSRI